MSIEIYDPELLLHSRIKLYGGLKKVKLAAFIFIEQTFGIATVIKPSRQSKIKNIGYYPDSKYYFSHRCTVYFIKVIK